MFGNIQTTNIPSYILREVLECILLGTKERDDPKQTWQSSVMADMKEPNLSWSKTKAEACIVRAAGAVDTLWRSSWTCNRKKNV